MLPEKLQNRTLIGLVVLLALTGIVGVAVVWVYVSRQPAVSPTPLPALNFATAAPTPTSAIPTLPPEWTASPFPTRSTPSGSQPAPAATSTAGALPTTPAAPVSATTQAASTAGGPTSTPTPTLAAPETPVIPPGGYPGAGSTPTPPPAYP